MALPPLLPVALPSPQLSPEVVTAPPTLSLTNLLGPAPSFTSSPILSSSPVLTTSPFPSHRVSLNKLNAKYLALEEDHELITMWLSLMMSSRDRVNKENKILNTCLATKNKTIFMLKEELSALKNSKPPTSSQATQVGDTDEDLDDLSLITLDEIWTTSESPISQSPQGAWSLGAIPKTQVPSQVHAEC